MAVAFAEYLRHLGSLAWQSGGDLSRTVAGATCDSRQVRPGDVFCAMKGEMTDGHEYIPQALARGASAVICEKAVELPPGLPWVAVNDAYRAFGLVAEMACGFPARNLRMLGITGTNGKTTSAWLLREILRQDGRKTGMVGTVEYDVGGPSMLTADRTTPTPFVLQGLLSEMRANACTDAVLEVSSHALAQGRLGTACFDGAIFTNLTRDHLDYHHDFENYYNCKKRRFAEMLKEGAPAVINLDDASGNRLWRELPGARRLGFSLDDSCAEAFACVRALRQDVRGTVMTVAFADGVSWELASPLTGRYNAENLLGVACLAHALDIAETAVRKGISACHGAPGRLQRLEVPAGCPDVYVDYAHTDDALRKVLGALRPLCQGRLCVVFGCGGNRDRTKRPKMAQAACLADEVIVTSDNPRREKPLDIIADILPGFPAGVAYQVEPDRRAAIALAIRGHRTGDIVLLAGKGHEDYQEIDGVKHHFNDAEVASEIAGNI